MCNLKKITEKYCAVSENLMRHHFHNKSYFEPHSRPNDDFFLATDRLDACGHTDFGFYYES